MNNFRCEPDQTGISFEYGHASTVSKNVHSLCATGVFVWIEPSRGTGPRATVVQRTSRREP